MQDMKLFLFYLFLIVVGGGISYFLINKVILPFLEKIEEVSAKKLMRDSKQMIINIRVRCLIISKWGYLITF
ncbi:hypothetical protein [Bacillus cereus]|uniref:Uncharacterized protein n=1 Tax=Bacillus cereus 03BB108 TaxID=451709 RepID=A0AAN0W5P1_BACCE|nr:hypothetical protein [Bacillus cereus]AJI09851.1 hypothetical protein AK40_5112 [Bacillus cereus 03BB108]EDX63660.1 hypothetical protein BC03BB108_0907 [Bacillus cereus 03BB108]QKG99335.1 hypothetical protein FOC96_27495 [Bacillus cereus]